MIKISNTINKYVSRISNAAKNFRQKPLNTAAKYAIKAGGLAGAGILLYDAHKEGARISNQYAKKREAEMDLYWFDNTRNLIKPSQFNINMKDKLFNWELSQNFTKFVNAGIGYAKGFGSMVCNDVMPWALSAAAIFTKGTAAKLSGAALGLYSIYGFAKNVCGLGVSQK